MSKQLPPLAFDLARHRTGVTQLQASAADVGLPDDPELTFVRDVEVAVTVEEMAGGVRLRLRASTAAVAECFRCLDPFELHLSTRFDVICRVTDLGDPDDRVIRVDPRRPVVCLAQLVREALLLEVPMRRICRQDCAGLCPGCGANLNREPCRCSPEAAGGC